MAAGVPIVEMAGGLVSNYPHGDFDLDLLREFFQGLVNHGMLTLHLDNLKGANAHHQAETLFKGFGRALRMALSVDEKNIGHIPSTKGTL